MSRWSPSYQMQPAPNHFANFLYVAGEGVEELGDAFAVRNRQRALDAEVKNRQRATDYQILEGDRRWQRDQERDAVDDARHGYQKGAPQTPDYQGRQWAPDLIGGSTGVQVGAGGLKPGIEQRGSMTYRRAWDEDAQARDAQDNRLARELDARAQAQGREFTHEKDMIGVREASERRLLGTRYANERAMTQFEAGLGKWDRTQPKPQAPMGFEEYMRRNMARLRRGELGMSRSINEAMDDGRREYESIYPESRSWQMPGMQPSESGRNPGTAPAAEVDRTSAELDEWLNSPEGAPYRNQVRR
jgi:hypothetical protein